MKKQLKRQLLELTGLLNEAHDFVKKSVERGKPQDAVATLEDCQNTAITIGTAIDENEGDGTTAVKALEDYCESVFVLHENILNGNPLNIHKEIKKLNKSYTEIRNRITYDIPEIKEVVFLPYKASMWDSLESVWKKADADPSVEAKVIPITYYEDYNLEANHPDEIYIHNPYDDMNYVTSVHPAFFSKTIKEYTEKLIYIPYFVLEEIDVKNKAAVEANCHFAQVPAVIHADEVIVQSENMRQFYIECIVQLTGEKTRRVFESKIKGTGSPKIEKIKSMTLDDITIPESWEDYINGDDGNRKKIVLYNTSVSALLSESEKMLIKMENVFKIFEQNRDKVELLWRPHPLIQATISSMRPQLWEKYRKLVERYKNANIGIYDDSADMDRALVLADAYYGDGSSLVTLCKAINMPIMIQNASVLCE